MIKNVYFKIFIVTIIYIGRKYNYRSIFYDYHDVIMAILI